MNASEASVTPGSRTIAGWSHERWPLRAGPRTERWGVGRYVADSRLAASQPRRLATNSAKGGFDLSLSERIGSESGVAVIGGHVTPASESSHANPSSSELSNSFVTR